ncbi:TlpA disulfide reductase family protein [Roseivirga sp. BDSF3-8]|uniref:TlpA disulfide reductase family protein n=1 Tax=Roseivirga sp. BDSF3-8 TaxID=3241598 RepID=UPI00353228DF
MKYLVRVFSLGLFIFLTSFNNDQAPVRVIKYPELLNLIDEPGEDILVVNFWATWCGPCVKELPYFESVNKKYAANGIKTVLVSLDDADVLESKVIPFVKRKQLDSEVVLLDETDFNAFINKVDKRWSGAIPATLIIDKGSGDRIFIGEPVNQQELENYIAKFSK